MLETQEKQWMHLVLQHRRVHAIPFFFFFCKSVSLQSLGPFVPLPLTRYYKSAAEVCN